MAGSTGSLLMLLLWLVWAPCNGFYDASFTFSVPARRMECFYEDFEAGSTIEVQYLVLTGQNINFMVKNPRGAFIVIDNSNEGWWPLDIDETGEYAICLDNTLSKLSSKQVFLSMTTTAGTRDLKPSDSEETMDPIAEEMIKKIDGLDQKLSKVVSIQHYLRAREARHRKTVESNDSKVFWWSLVECVLMVTSGAIQVVVIRSLFRTRRKDGIRT